MAGSLALRELSATATAALAGPSDDSDLRALLRRSVIPGAVRIALTREPEYFAAEGLAGAQDVTIVVRRDGHVMAMGRCSVNSLARNGRVQRIGYLAELRVVPGTPGSSRVLRDGYEFLAELTARSGVDGFFTSITIDNDRARRVLEHGGRFGLPAYRALTGLVTLVSPVDRGVRPTGSVTEATCRKDERAALTTFLARRSLDAHLSLSWDGARWVALARHGITPGDFGVVRRGGRIVAAATVWDQRSFRQTVIDGYTGVLKVARPLVNFAQAIRRRPGLPAPGSVLAQGAVFGACVEDAADWPRLWRVLQSRAATMGLSWLVLARDARDPHLAVLRRLLHATEYRTTLYDVTWRDRPAWTDAWDGRMFRPEVGLL